MLILSTNLNNDSKVDLTIVNFYDDSVSVLLDNGDGTFQNQLIYTIGFNPLSMIAMLSRLIINLI